MKKDAGKKFKDSINRRDFIEISTKGIGLLTGATLLGNLAFASEPYDQISREDDLMLLDDYPFKLGVASGDPNENSVVLWTRLVTNPLMVDGNMPFRSQKVKWEISKNKSFDDILHKGKVKTDPEWAHSVHIEAEGLEPDSIYYYRFRTGTYVSPIGKTKTTPKRDDNLNELKFAFLSCQSYPGGYYNAYDHLIDEDLDVIFFLGDYIYEGQGGEGPRGLKHSPWKELENLEDYRMRYAQYKSDPALQKVHAAFPWFVTFDDHEVKNNWGGEDDPAFLKRRAAAFKAYYEHMPLRRSSVPQNEHIQIYRKCSYGNLVDFNILDTRQFRSKPACGGGRQTLNCPDLIDPSRTIYGEEQERWLFNNLKTSTKKWNILANQVIMAFKDDINGEGIGVGIDRWDGYMASRRRLFDTIKTNEINNVIVITGDSHKNWVNNLHDDFLDLNSQILATEFGGTSITSGGNGTAKFGENIQKENPHIKYVGNQRGYVRCKLTPEEIKMDYQVVPYIDKKGSPITTTKSFHVMNGIPGAVENQ